MKRKITKNPKKKFLIMGALNFKNILECVKLKLLITKFLKRKFNQILLHKKYTSLLKNNFQSSLIS